MKKYTMYLTEEIILSYAYSFDRDEVEIQLQPGKQCLQLVWIRPYLYGFCVVYTDIWKLCSIIQKRGIIEVDM